MKPIYRSFLLRLWQAGSPEEPAWHASLEDPHTRQVIGFEDLDRLNEYLRLLTALPEHGPEHPDVL